MCATHTHPQTKTVSASKLIDMSDLYSESESHPN